MQVTQQTKDLIRAMLAIANARSLSSDNLFEIINRFDQPISAMSAHHTSIRLTDADLNEIQERLQSILGQIARRGAFGDIVEEVAERLNGSGPVLSFSVENGRMVRRESFKRFTLETLVSSALEAIIRDNALVVRLAECKWCHRFRLDFEGKPRSFCSDDHRLKYDAADAKNRVARWRANKKGGKHGKKK